MEPSSNVVNIQRVWDVAGWLDALAIPVCRIIQGPQLQCFVYLERLTQKTVEEVDAT